MTGIHKRFPGVHALKGVDLTVDYGEVHAVVGENGAGKSTLMLVLAGVYQPDSGSIHFNGHQAVSIRSERHAQELGIAIVYQERSLFSNLSVAENIYAGRQPLNRFGSIDTDALTRQSRDLLAHLELEIDPRLPLDHLSFAHQQMVEVAKALSLNAKLLILDEPTAALTRVETEALFRVIQRLQSQSVGVIYISHRLDEIFQIARHATVLKDGEKQGTLEVEKTTPRELVRMMVGREMLYDFQARTIPADAPTLLQVTNLSDPPGDVPGEVRLRDINLSLRRGEILAIAGLEGSGRDELALSLFGARPLASGTICVEGQPQAIRSPYDAIQHGIGYLPPDRKESGLFLEMAISDNIASGSLGRFGRWWWSESRRDQTAEQYRQQLQIASPTVQRLVQTLSGGNQQKVVLSKWLLVDPQILIVNEPTRGIDVSVKVEVHRLLRQLADEGKAIIVISSELPEVLAVADTIAVMRAGRIAGQMPRAEASEEQIMTLASFDTHH